MGGIDALIDDNFSRLLLTATFSTMSAEVYANTLYVCIVHIFLKTGKVVNNI